jgi:hypothetical protein
MSSPRCYDFIIFVAVVPADVQGEFFVHVKSRCLITADTGHIQAKTMMASQEVANFFDYTGSSFRLLPETGNIEGLLDAGARRHDGKQRFTTLCDAIIIEILHGFSA